MIRTTSTPGFKPPPVPPSSDFIHDGWMSESCAPFHKGDRVVIEYPEHPGYDGKHGTIGTKPVFKPRPKQGKTPGWWVHVNIDLTPGLKTHWVEIHANHVKAEKNNPLQSEHASIGDSYCG